MCIINFHHYGSIKNLNETFGDDWIYIGREYRRFNLPASPLANPFRGKIYGREEAIAKYRLYLWRQIKLDNRQIIEALLKINDNCKLVCFCHPKPCHGDIVIRAANWVKNNL